MKRFHIEEKNGGRRSPRSKLMLSGKLETEGRIETVRILDLSRHGALVAGNNLPSEESAVTLHCGNQSVAGWLCWLMDGRAGLNFNREVDHASFVRPTATPKHFEPFAPDPTWRRPSFRGDPLTPEERLFVDRLRSEDRLPAPPIDKS